MSRHRRELGLAAGAVGPCEICAKPRKLVADHCHRHHLARGRICSTCNVGLGMFKDDARLIRAAAEYLEQRDARVRAKVREAARGKVRLARPETPFGFAAVPSAVVGWQAWRA